MTTFYYWVLLLQVYEWMSIAFVINHEKGVQPDKIMRKYNNQNLIRNNFNRKENFLYVIFYVISFLVTLGYLGYKVYLAAVDID